MRIRTKIASTTNCLRPIIRSEAIPISDYASNQLFFIRLNLKRIGSITFINLTVTLPLLLSDKFIIKTNLWRTLIIWTHDKTCSLGGTRWWAEPRTPGETSSRQRSSPGKATGTGNGPAHRYFEFGSVGISHLHVWCVLKSSSMNPFDVRTRGSEEL